MEYQELYSRYQTAIKLRELNIDNNFRILKDIFEQRILSSITIHSELSIIPYLSGIREVFKYVEEESNKVNQYRNELDKLFAEEK